MYALTRYARGDISSRGATEAASTWTFDGLMRERAFENDRSPLLAYPKSKYGVDDYEFFNPREFNRLVDGAAEALIRAGVKPVVSTLLSLAMPWSDSMAIQTWTTSSLSLDLRDWAIQYSSCHLVFP